MMAGSMTGWRKKVGGTHENQMYPKGICTDVNDVLENLGTTPYGGAGNKGTRGVLVLRPIHQTCYPLAEVSLKNITI